MHKPNKRMLPLCYSAIFTGFCLYLLFNHKVRFWLELDLAPFIPWLKTQPLIGLITILILMGAGSYFDRLLMTEGTTKHPLLAFILAGVLISIAGFLYAIYITNSYYTYAHDNFYITVLVITLGSFALYAWLKARL